MTALTLERIEELREWLADSAFDDYSYDEGLFLSEKGTLAKAALLSLLDKEAAQLKDAKAGATDDRPLEVLCGPNGTSVAMKPTAPSPDPEDEAMRDFDLALRPGVTAEKSWAIERTRSRLAGVRVTREWMHLFAEHLTHNNWDDAIAMLRSLGVRVGGDDEK